MSGRSQSDGRRTVIEQGHTLARTARQAARLVRYGLQHYDSVDRTQNCTTAVPVDLKAQAHCRLSVRPSDIQFEITLTTPVANRLSRKGIGCAGGRKQLLPESPNVDSCRKRCRNRPHWFDSLREHPNTAGPDFLLTQSQSNEHPSNSSDTLFLGVQWVHWIGVALTAPEDLF